MQNRVKYYDGIRGVASLWIASIHFFAAFYWPKINFDIEEGVGFLKTILLDGDLCVFIFWLLSGIVINYGFVGPQDDFQRRITGFPIKRYFRLVLPVFFSCAICYFFLEFDLFYFKEVKANLMFSGNMNWLDKFYNFKPNLISFLKITFFDVFLIGNSNYNGPLWTIGPELFGPLLCVLMLVLYRNNSNRFFLYSIWFLFFFIGGLSNIHFYYYIFFIIGLIIYEVENNSIRVQSISLVSFFRFIFNSKMIAYFLLVFSLVISFIYENKPPPLLFFFFTPLRALAVILIIKNTKYFQRILSFKLFQFFGKISFAVYLIHLPLLFSFISYIYIKNFTYFTCNIYLLFLIFISLLILFSYIFYKVFEVRCILWAKKISHILTNFNK